jgi:Domain of unknown function (DUF3859)
MRANLKGAVVAVLVCLCGVMATAEPAPPVISPGITIVELGIYCRAEAAGTEAAPETTLGYIAVLPAVPQFVFRQQQVPARLGMSFGVVTVSDRDIVGVRIETWKPGAEKSELWYADMVAGDQSIRGFSFDFPEELITGIWRMEAWDGETLLYRVAFEVLPGTALPGVGSDCNLLS